MKALKTLKSITVLLILVIGLMSTMVLAQDEELGLIELIAEVDVLEDDRLVVGGIEVAPAGAFLPAMLNVGDLVMITGYFTDDGTLIASELVLLDDPEADTDADGVLDILDNCPDLANADQLDTDLDGLGDACDSSPLDGLDADADGVVDSLDNCIEVPNADQLDADGDDVGDACDPDLVDTDNDGVVDSLDNCPEVANADQLDADGNGVGDVCEQELEEDIEETLSCVGADPHPAAQAIAEAYDLEYATVIGWHCDGIGFGNIVIALRLAEELETEADTLLTQFKTEGPGWGALMQEAGVHPGEFFSNRARINRGNNAGDTSDEGEDGQALIEPAPRGQTINPGRPNNPGRPDNPGRPENPGRSDNTGRPENPGRPDHAGGPGGRP